MSYRSVVISDTAQLSCSLNNIVIQKDGEKFRVPLEDISVILVDTGACVITSSLMSKASECGTCVIFTDDKHLPSGVLLPLNKHYSQLLVANRQLKQSMPFKKQIWRDVIISKIKNQSICLSILGIDKVAILLKNLTEDIKSGDSENQESTAAGYYFRSLFGNDFNRRDEGNSINSFLNYGYAIMRAAVSRELVAFGFITSIGIHHCNQYNGFNLADDFIEPFRPVVDLWVARNSHNLNEGAFKERKYELLSLLNSDIILDGKKTAVLNAIREVVKSYSSAVESKDKSLLKLPTLLDFKLHKYE